MVIKLLSGWKEPNGGMSCLLQVRLKSKKMALVNNRVTQMSRPSSRELLTKQFMETSQIKISQNNLRYKNCLKKMNQIQAKMTKKRMMTMVGRQWMKTKKTWMMVGKPRKKKILILKMVKNKMILKRMKYLQW